MQHTKVCNQSVWGGLLPGLVNLGRLRFQSFLSITAFGSLDDFSWFESWGFPAQSCSKRSMTNFCCDAQLVSLHCINRMPSAVNQDPNFLEVVVFCLRQTLRCNTFEGQFYFGGRFIDVLTSGTATPEGLKFQFWEFYLTSFALGRCSFFNRSFTVFTGLKVLLGTSNKHRIPSI